MLAQETHRQHAASYPAPPPPAPRYTSAAPPLLFVGPACTQGSLLRTRPSILLPFLFFFDTSIRSSESPVVLEHSFGRNGNANSKRNDPRPPAHHHYNEEDPNARASECTMDRSLDRRAAPDGKQMGYSMLDFEDNDGQRQKSPHGIGRFGIYVFDLDNQARNHQITKTASRYTGFFGCKSMRFRRVHAMTVSLHLSTSERDYVLEFLWQETSLERRRLRPFCLRGGLLGHSNARRHGGNHSSLRASHRALRQLEVSQYGRLSVSLPACIGWHRGLHLQSDRYGADALSRRGVHRGIPDEWLHLATAHRRPSMSGYLPSHARAV
ncbi:hypothetical protein B0H19DRAFT_1371470 [Mycena capillaripes]|nr:hypothetical protein B0H19DRAFT_1371470 [Mycena capillaripes]